MVYFKNGYIFSINNSGNIKSLTHKATGIGT